MRWVPENTARGGSQKSEVGPKKYGGGSEEAPLPSVSPSEEEEDDGSARARANPDDAIQSFWNGQAFAKSEPASAIPSDGVTEAHCEAFRELADRFGRRKNAKPEFPTNRSDSDLVLHGLVRTLRTYPPDIVEQAIENGLRDAHTVWLESNQNGSAGKGQGGLASLNRYLEKVFRSKADDLMRARKRSEAKDRTERIVHEEVLEKRVQGIRSAGGSRKRNSSLEDIAADMGWETTYAEAQGGT